MAKYKMTGCARFFLFLLILGPIAYFGSKFLLDNGHLDGFKDKIEQSDSGNTMDTSPETIAINPSNEDLTRLQNRFDELRKGYLEQEATIKEQATQIAQQNQEIEALRRNKGTNNGSSNYDNTNRPTTTTGSTNTTQPTTTGSSSLDDLLREADSNLGATPPPTTSSSTVRQTLGNWSFSFSGVQGSIEFYQDRGRLFSKTTINGSGQMNVDELTRQGDRFTVTRSNTGEYYIVKSNGDLDAFDRNGYQTTCRKR